MLKKEKKNMETNDSNRLHSEMRLLFVYKFLVYYLAWNNKHAQYFFFFEKNTHNILQSVITFIL